MEKSEEEQIWDGGSAPKPPRFSAFAPGFLGREASCARPLGIPAPESALGLRLRRALPSAQVRSVYQGCKLKSVSHLHKRLDAPGRGVARYQRIAIQRQRSFGRRQHPGEVFVLLVEHLPNLLPHHRMCHGLVAIRCVPSVLAFGVVGKALQFGQSFAEGLTRSKAKSLLH